MCGCVCDCTVGHLTEINNGVSRCTELLSAGRDWRTWLGCCPPLSGGTVEEGPVVIKSRLERFLL